MASRITIDIADDGAAAVTMEMDGAEPQMMNFPSAAEALDAVGQMLEGTESPDAMWQQEAAAREAPMTNDEEMM